MLIHGIEQLPQTQLSQPNIIDKCKRKGERERGANNQSLLRACYRNEITRRPYGRIGGLAANPRAIHGPRLLLTLIIRVCIALSLLDIKGPRFREVPFLAILPGEAPIHVESAIDSTAVRIGVQIALEDDTLVRDVFVVSLQQEIVSRALFVSVDCNFPHPGRRARWYRYGLGFLFGRG